MTGGFGWCQLAGGRWSARARPVSTVRQQRGRKRGARELGGSRLAAEGPREGKSGNRSRDRRGSGGCARGLWGSCK